MLNIDIIVLLIIAKILDVIRSERCINEIFINNEPIQKAIGFHKIITPISQSTVKNVRVAYLSNAWAKASSYTVSAGKKFSGSYNYAGIDVNISFTQSVSVTIPANSAKESKLGAYADITFEKRRIQYYQGGSLYKTEYDAVPIKYQNKTLKVIYK